MSFPQPDFRQPSIPWQGVFSLARLWAGSGSLFDWLIPVDWDIQRKWGSELVRARAADALLLRFEQSVMPRLPRHPGEWADALEQELRRSVEITLVPSAHTDWTATLSEFGRYPSSAYVERRPRGSFDTSLTRTLRWLSSAIMRAEQLVAVVLGHRPLTDAARTRLRYAVDLPEVQGAAETVMLSEFDASVCASVGGIWLLVARSARQFSALWQGSAQDQLLALAPILPGLGSQIFELAVLGTSATAVRGAQPSATWSSRTPLGAAEPGAARLTAEMSEGTVDWHYQTVPMHRRSDDLPYRVLSKGFGGSLRPDLWITVDVMPKELELIVECKYSFDQNYIAEGITQILAYSFEYPPPPGIQQIQMIVVPEDAALTARSWRGRLAIGTPKHLDTLVRALARGEGSEVLASWV